MKLFYFLFILLVVNNNAFCKQDRPDFIFVHGLNANIDSKSYLPFFNQKLKTNNLQVRKLPGHDKKNNLKELNKKNIKRYIKSLTKLTRFPEKTIIYAHSMGAILLRNYMPIDDRRTFKKIVYLSPGVPPKYYSFFKFVLNFLPQRFSIPSYSPKNLRLNDSIPASAYHFLFSEVDIFKSNLELLSNEEIWIHEKDEVVDVESLIKYFPKSKVIKEKSEFPHHVFFL